MAGSSNFTTDRSQCHCTVHCKLNTLPADIQSCHEHAHFHHQIATRKTRDCKMAHVNVNERCLPSAHTKSLFNSVLRSPLHVCTSSSRIFFILVSLTCRFFYDTAPKILTLTYKMTHGCLYVITSYTAFFLFRVFILPHS